MYNIREESVGVREVLSLGDVFAEHGGQQLAMEVLRERGDKAMFMRRIGERMKNTDALAAADRALGFDSASDAGGYSLTRALRAAHRAAHGDPAAWEKAGLERDVSNLHTNNSGCVPNGFFVPYSLLMRDFNVGTATQAGNLIGAARGEGALVNDPLRRLAPLVGLGAIVASGLKATLDVPRFASSNTADWLSETGAAVEILETTENADLSPHRVAARMNVSVQADRQSSVVSDGIIGRQLATALWEQAQFGALNGDGTSDSPVGIRNTTGITAVVGGDNGAAPAWAHFVDLEKGPATANSAEYASGFVVNAATRGKLRTTVRGTGLPHIWSDAALPLLGHRAAVTNLLPSNLSKGTANGTCSSVVFSSDWSKILFALYGPGVDILVNPYTDAVAGKIRIVASMHVGVSVLQPGAFSKIDDLITG
ncbi:MAG: phage major capsid protein [Gammaproteobacteria bacterium]|nr:phage major capsid protein [Rhodocyclaceae bacterium]MBU3907946.1 phage major capsid protein [Gammaproteobacteria bacterium]MBU3989788.1 phage major capsid protein [Gammaproteobacteria bacterium]MBU4003852.1 phage major capsid protein [Gammaproteobacteria bacterium]MBU4021730.1 phage major capsid protein [Gammaproteobacteria bacterium]